MASTETVTESRPLRLYVSLVASLVTYFGARLVLEMPSLPTAWKVFAALVPVPIFGWLLYELVRGSRALDELQRRIHLEALAVAYPLTVMLLMTLGLVELAVPLNKDDWSYRHVWQMQGVIYLIGFITARRRYEIND